MINARIFNGDIVCIRQQDEVENGEIAAIRVDNEEATLKRFRKFEDRIVLEPENPTCTPFVFWGEEMARVHVLGKATHIVSLWGGASSVCANLEKTNFEKEIPSALYSLHNHSCHFVHGSAFRGGG